ncbi:MAG: RNA polymerase alpha subunit C-terminal domain-containing protein [Cecembia sp.]
MEKQKTLRICEKGHRYYKSSDCPTCPKCEKEKRPQEGFLALLSSPARSALVEYLGIDTLDKLSKYSEKEILKLHGMGKASLPILRKALAEKGLSFKEESAKK